MAVLEAQVVLEVARDLAHQPLEGQLAHQQLRRLLIAPDLAQCHRARAEAAHVLDAALGTSCLRGVLPPVDLRTVCLVRAILELTK